MNIQMNRSLALLCILLLLPVFFILSAVPCRAETIPADFITGADISELAAQENSGVRYYDENGNEADALSILADHCVKAVRIRIWNDPFDENGNGYGGGNINAETAAALSARAAGYGMKTLLDFHYSDFWADPSRQLVPKAWASLNLKEKSEALYAYTRESLALVLDAGGDVFMVQVGNEINNGMCGESDLEAMAELVSAGCRAVRDTAAERGITIQTAIHLTDLQDTGRVIEITSDLAGAGAEFDAVGLSYYPYWHGSLRDLAAAVSSIRDLGKAVFVAETSWPFSLTTGDGWGDVIGEDPGIYPVSAEGQAQAVREVCEAASYAGADGVYYWGSIWTPVGSNADTNRELWEKYGSGWASSYSVSYDPEHTADSYGGCAWDNQAMFGYDGRPLPVLDLYRQIASGSVTYDPDVLFPPEEDAPAAEVDAGNLVRNPSFEEEDRSMWVPASNKEDIPFDYQDKSNDAHSGNTAFHFWSAQDMDFSIEQTVTGLAEGVYEASVWSQGGDMKDASMTFYVKADGQIYEASFMNTKWIDWQHPVLTGIPVTSGELTLGVHIVCGAKSWGTLDDFSLIMLP